MADNQQWLAAGLRMLEEFGAPGLTIERLMGQVGLSKGSFYHHFGGMAGFKTALLAHHESRFTTSYIEAVEQDPLATPRVKLDRLLDIALSDGDHSSIHSNLRAWAMQDPEVRAAQERMDRIRVDYLRGLWFDLSGDAEQALPMARLIYFILIGADHVLPTASPGELRKLYELVLGPVPIDETHGARRG